MSDNQLLLDWMFKFPGDPDAFDGWSYDWEDAECSTAHPTPRDGYATMFLITNHTDSPIRDFQNFIKHVNENVLRRGPKVDVEMHPLSEDDDFRRDFTLKQGDIVLRGDNSASGDIEKDGDTNLAFYARIESTTEKGLLLLRVFEKSANHGYAAILEHSRVEFDIGDDLKLVAVTGLQPGEPVEDENDGLATRFTILEKGQEVARCHLSYRDGSWEPCAGPTVEMIAVHRDHRGKGLLPLLWYWVKCFIEENFTLECFNNDAPHGHVMIKATHLTNAEADRKDGEPISDKEFFYNYAGFSVRELKGIPAMMSSRRPKDEEAVLYLPLLSKQQIHDRTTYLGPQNIHWTVNRGACNCDACGRVAVGHVRCGRCKLVFYCNKSCQRRDWKRHKQFCGKKKEEVHEVLVDKGLRVKRQDGSYASVMGTGL